MIDFLVFSFVLVCYLWISERDWRELMKEERRQVTTDIWAEKSISVFKSCKTLRQLDIARRWSELVFCRNYLSVPDKKVDGVYQKEKERINSAPRYY